jgi:hypothetical protein
MRVGLLHIHSFTILFSLPILLRYKQGRVKILAKYKLTGNCIFQYVEWINNFVERGGRLSW